ncbi:hypothetical protein M7I_4627 [Glarea lozoyensis 74030]|uniref:Uncharacterized protein n=1 Tax=Glarea lozoyensis (strain ATCC 74030 / MF5533) TaxID=1104152 RepID=H0EPP2_GLAL7|nr:hypothetical protein M7I_4627 [Glarea lozoyensis 74030]
MIAILLGLIMGGVEHPWSSWKIILPLVLGGVGWIVFHIQQAFTENPSAGSGLILSVLLPAIMAGLPESDVASSSAAYSFIRTFGYIWGVTIPSLIFTNTFNKNLHLIPSTTLQDMLKDGQAYSFASEAHHLRNSVDPIVWSQVVDVYSKSLKVIWWLGLGISIFGFFLVGIEKGLPLRNTLETDYGIQDEKKTSDAESGEEIRRAVEKILTAVDHD